MTENKNHMAAMKKMTVKTPWYKQIYNAVEGGLQFVFRLFTIVMLFICFFTIFGLTALIIKLFGKKLMPTYEEGVESYWEDKDVIDLSPDQVVKQG